MHEIVLLRLLRTCMPIMVLVKDRLLVLTEGSQRFTIDSYCTSKQTGAFPEDDEP
jgi:hypothetical protein